MEAYRKKTDTSDDAGRARIAPAPRTTEDYNPAADAPHNLCKRDCAECPLAHLCRPVKNDQAQS